MLLFDAGCLANVARLFTLNKLYCSGLVQNPVYVVASESSASGWLYFYSN